ncbi:MAG: flavin reductase family protein, partial [Flavobacteriales bacterium]|nr:flavin reductase family protein [Flavobacteriales bacterium]
FSSNPPVLIFSPARGGRTNTTKHTYDNVKQHPEAVVHIVDEGLLDRMVISSLEYPQGVNEFDKAGLTMIESEKVKPPRIKESPVHLECKVLEVKELGSEGAAGNLIICQVVHMHYAEHLFLEDGRVDQQRLNLIGRLGGAWYTRAFGDSLFEVKSHPMQTVVGYDSIPPFVRDSALLTAQDLTRLAQAHRLPDETEVNDFKLDQLDEEFLKSQDDPPELQLALIKRCVAFIREERIDEAWMTILSYNP